MARDAADSAGRDGTVLDDLPDDVWQSLLRGDAAGHWWLEEGAQPVGPDFVLDKQAFEDGKRIGEAVSMLISADLADYSNDEKHYNRLGDELNARYGAGLVVHTDELGPSGPGPGFRRRQGGS
jgi:hypothetical protein